MLTCREIAKFLAAYLERELPDEQHATFEEHLKMCPPCLHYLEEYKTTIELGKKACQSEKRPEVPESLIKAILAARSSDGEKS